MKGKLMRTVLALLCGTLCLPACAEIVLVVSPKSALASITQEQAAQLYLGTATNMTPLDKAEASLLRAEFYKKVTNKEPAQVRAIWAKLVFTGKGRMPRELAGNEEVKKAVAADPNAIGYIDKSAVDASVKVVLSVP